MVSASVSAGGQITGVHQLVAPVALYPDPLLGLVLTASTQPNDIQAVASNSGGSGNLSPAAQGLSHYPELAQWMSQNQDWSNQLGYEFADRPSRVLKAVQDLRHRAFDSGALRSSDHILVTQNDGYIQILPRDPDRIFIPRYSPEGVFAGLNPGVTLQFGEGLPAGDWLSFYPVWGKHAVYQGDWFAYSRDHGGWQGLASMHVGMFGHISGINNTHEWRVASDAQIRQDRYRNAAHANGNYARPTAFGGANGNATFPGDQQQQRNDQTQDQNQNSNSNRNSSTQWNQDQTHSTDRQMDQQNASQQNANQSNVNQSNSPNDSSRSPMDQPAQADQSQANGQNGANVNESSNANNPPQTTNPSQANPNQDQAQGQNQNQNQDPNQ